MPTPPVPDRPLTIQIPKTVPVLTPEEIAKGFQLLGLEADATRTKLLSLQSLHRTAVEARPNQQIVIDSGAYAESGDPSDG